MGRDVHPFDQQLWNEHLDDVAFEVVYQKFAASPNMRSLLLSTGDKIIAEATIKDNIWGIGIDVGDPRVQDPKQWKGINVLGFALMKARAQLRIDAKAVI